MRTDCIGLSAISYQLSAISYQLSAISYQPSAISYKLSAISYKQSEISDPKSGIGNRQSVKMHPSAKRNVYTGIILAVVATIIWSGNFIVSRGISGEIPPVSLSFYRWLTASVLIMPFALKAFIREREIVLRHWKYLFWVALTGIALFNTFVYVAGHYTSAINMALIGTTSSPVFAILLAAVFLHERIRFLRVIGLLLCIAGIITLLSQGSIERLIAFRFSTGDWWILSGALFFAIYNTLVKRKPASISAINFLFISFATGTLLLLPFYLWELSYNSPVAWNGPLLAIIAYLGLGTSVISYLCWNNAIARLGSARTALFGNLIPVFSTIEAMLILDERITFIHILSGILVLSGLFISNLKQASTPVKA